MKSEKRLSEKPVPAFVNRIQSKLSAKKGWIAAIESKSGEYVLGVTLLEAARKARETFPGKIFYFVRIGYPYVHRFSGSLTKVSKK
ncbi:MAG: hypothetical protein ABII90_14750 [Bacteroidota bacterium]